MPQPTIHHPMIPARKSPSTTRRAVRTLTAAAGLLCLAGSLLACATTQQQAVQDLREGIDREEIAIRLTEDADRARMAGNIDRAIELYREALDYSARFPDTWNNLGLLHLERGDEAKAINAFVQASILDPTDPRPPANTGIVYSNIGRETEAMRFFHDAARHRALVPPRAPRCDQERASSQRERVRGSRAGQARPARRGRSAVA